jgi:hypothetical protein
MMKKRIAPLIAAVASVVLLSNILNFTVSTSRFSESYPAVVCPPNRPGLSTAISLTSTTNLVRKTGTSSMQSTQVGIRRFAVASQSAIIESGRVTPVVWQVRKDVWAGAVPCSSPQLTQWFVGATAGITSKGSLNIVNSGLGRALVDILIYTENGALAPRAISIRANSYIRLSLASLAPGSKRLAIALLPKSGRINGFLIDERGRGLRALGGDLVNSVTAASTHLQIPAIPVQAGPNASTSHTLRLLVPGEVDARISAEIRSTDGTFAPVGINGQVIAHQKVIELPMNIKMEAGSFALHITSDQPILGSVFSPTLVQGKRDFLWSTPAAALTEFTLATTGLSPTLVFTGKRVKLKLDVTYNNGKLKSFNIEEEDIATFALPGSARSVTFKAIAKGVSGAALITSRSGYGYLPLNPGSVPTKSSIPASNIRVLNP